MNGPTIVLETSESSSKITSKAQHIAHKHIQSKEAYLSHNSFSKVLSLLAKLLLKPNTLPTSTYRAKRLIVQNKMPGM
jgi:hypothetical protein